ncbi:MAG TPA: hypothetical protein VLL05_19280 [Terriglobales bacterium]|nr:hypothetical protein [Terriglobales bacterium]
MHATETEMRDVREQGTNTVAPPSCRQSRGHLALAAAGGGAHWTAAETAALQ